MADGVPTPWSVESSLTEPTKDAIGIGLVSPVQIPAAENAKDVSIFSLSQLQSMYGFPFLGGFITAGASVDEKSHVMYGMFRYSDPESAQRAAQILSENAPALPSGFPSIDGARPIGISDTPYPRVAVAAPRGDLLMVAAGRAESLARASDLAAKSLQMQIKKSVDYSPTPYSGFPPLNVDMDRDGVIGRLLPHTGDTQAAYVQLGLSKGASPFDGYRSMYAHTIANIDSRARLDRFATLFGVDLVAVSEVPVFAVLYRTREPAAAQLLIRDRVPDGLAKVEVQGIPTDSVRCTFENTARRITRCWIAWDRYVVSLGSSDPKQATQAAAAQYSILQSVR